MLDAFSLVIPAYNEADRIGQTVTTVLNYLRAKSPQSEVIVVDDGSTDATADVVRDVFLRPEEIETRLIQRSPNEGKGAAVRAGLNAATRPVALFSDADLSTPIDEAPKLLEPIFNGELDVAFGSRALNRKLIGHRQAWYREEGGRVFNLIMRLTTGLPYWDTQCGFKAFRMSAFRPILAQTESNGFGFDVEFIYLAHKAGLRLREIPVRWDHKEGSKVDYLRDSWRMLKEVAALRTR
ncbi:MAG: glycosyltransferase family 2 protein [Verrucomicrobiota bacterium]|nr:glycosyltransferase family 2 protein [Verrucomicrobiota bacterium]